MFAGAPPMLAGALAVGFGDDESMLVLAFTVLCAVVFIVMLASFVPLFALWVQALSANAPVGFLHLVGMRLRRVSPKVIVMSRIQAVRAGLDISTVQLESHHLAGGHVADVVQALAAAHSAGLPMTWEDATRIDLAGYEPLEAVQGAIEVSVREQPGKQQGKIVLETSPVNWEQYIEHIEEQQAKG